MFTDTMHVYNMSLLLLEAKAMKSYFKMHNPCAVLMRGNDYMASTLEYRPATSGSVYRTENSLPRLLAAFLQQSIAIAMSKNCHLACLGSHSNLYPAASCSEHLESIPKFPSSAM